MKIQELDCPFCDTASNWEADSIDFHNSEIYIRATCDNCHKTVIISIPLVYEGMRMFVTPKNKKIQTAVDKNEETK